MSWFSSLFGSRRVSAPPSCLVLGVVKSLKETPESWDTSHLDVWRHTPTGLSIYCCGFDSLALNPHKVLISGTPRETHAEMALLKEAVREVVTTKRARENAAAEALMAPRVSFFTELGCPSPTPPVVEAAPASGTDPSRHRSRRKTS